MIKLMGWLFVIGLLLICVASDAWFYSHHAEWGVYIILGIVAAIVAYIGCKFYKSKKS